MGFIDRTALLELARSFGGGPYGDYLQGIAEQR
jgi:hypothetical protein